jgi:tetratricopeptide (TPR) repeat protein
LQLEVIMTLRSTLLVTAASALLASGPAIAASGGGGGGGGRPSASGPTIDAAIKQVDDAIADPAASLAPAAGLPKLASADGDAAYLVASGLINEGRYEDALGSLREAALVFGPHPDILTYEGFANRKLGNFKTAIGFYSAALVLQPNHRGANEYLGEYYVEIGDMTRAKAQLAKLNTICKFGCEEAEELRRWIDGRKS